MMKRGLATVILALALLAIAAAQQEDSGFVGFEQKGDASMSMSLNHQGELVSNQEESTGNAELAKEEARLDRARFLQPAGKNDKVLPQNKSQVKKNSSKPTTQQQKNGEKAERIPQNKTESNNTKDSPSQKSQQASPKQNTPVITSIDNNTTKPIQNSTAPILQETAKEEPKAATATNSTKAAEANDNASTNSNDGIDLPSFAQINQTENSNSTVANLTELTEVPNFEDASDFKDSITPDPALDLSSKGENLTQSVEEQPSSTNQTDSSNTSLLAATSTNHTEVKTETNGSSLKATDPKTSLITDPKEKSQNTTDKANTTDRVNTTATVNATASTNTTVPQAENATSNTSVPAKTVTNQTSPKQETKADESNSTAIGEQNSTNATTKNQTESAATQKSEEAANQTSTNNSKVSSSNQSLSNSNETSENSNKTVLPTPTPNATNATVILSNTTSNSNAISGSNTTLESKANQNATNLKEDDELQSDNQTASNSTKVITPEAIDQAPIKSQKNETNNTAVQNPFEKPQSINETNSTQSTSTNQSKVPTNDTQTKNETIEAKSVTNTSETTSQNQTVLEEKGQVNTSSSGKIQVPEIANTTTANVTVISAEKETSNATEVIVTNNETKEVTNNETKESSNTTQVGQSKQENVTVVAESNPIPTSGTGSQTQKQDPSTKIPKEEPSNASIISEVHEETTQKPLNSSEKSQTEKPQTTKSQQNQTSSQAPPIQTPHFPQFNDPSSATQFDPLINTPTEVTPVPPVSPAFEQLNPLYKTPQQLKAQAQKVSTELTVQEPKQQKSEVKVEQTPTATVQTHESDDFIKRQLGQNGYIFLAGILLASLILTFLICRKCKGENPSGFTTMRSNEDQFTGSPI